MIRKFGTNLSINVLEQDRTRSKPPQKKVKVRRGNNSGVQSRVDASLVKSVTFLAGPVGIELEPYTSLECVAKVVRFVDDWPSSSGQARKCGEIKPGDLVLRAQATTEVGTTYEGVIRVLKMSHSVRELSFISGSESVSDQIMLGLKGDRLPLSSLPDSSHSEHTEEMGGKQLSSGSCLTSLIAIGCPSRDERKFCDVIVDSSTPPAGQSSSRFDVSWPSPAKGVTNLETSWHPKPIPEDSIEASPILMPFSPTRLQMLAPTNEEIHVDPRSMSKVIRAMYASVAPFFGSPFPGRTGHVTENSIRMPVVEDEQVWEQVSAIHTSKMCLLQELSRTKAALVSFRDSSRHELHESLDRLFQENVTLHLKFEEKLRIARAEHEQTERDLKDYYLALCSTKEARIRELEASHDRLHSEVIENSRITGNHGCSDYENRNGGETLAVQLSFRKTEKNLEETEVVELDEELVRLRNENGTLLERLTRLSSQLESCGRCQMSTIENELQVLRTEKASIQDKLLSTECELSTLKNDLEAATCALLDQLEAQVCRLKYSGTKNDHGVFIEEVSTGSIDKDASSIDNFGVPIDSLENELISMEIFHEDEWALYGGTLLEQSNEITWLSSGSGEVGADALKVAKKRTLESSTLGTKLASSFDVRKGFSGIEDFVQSTQKRTLLLEVENVHYKKQLVKLENVWSKVKQVEYDGLVQSLRIELQNMERHFADSVVASGDALFHVRRRFLLFAIEKRGWLLEKTWYEDSLRHAHEDIERLKRNETEISTALSERDHDISVLDAKVASLEIQRNDLSFEVGEMASCMHDLAVEKEEITASFLLALQKLHALHIEKSSLSRHFADTRGEIGSMEIESHEKIRKNDALERSSQAQQTDISLRKSLLKNLFKANVNVVILQQTNECQRIQHQKDKEQMLLKMARMSMSSGEIHKENSALRRKLLAAGNAKARCKADNAPLPRREIEREKQLAASRLDVAKLQTSQIELQELLEQSTVNMQVACIQVAFLKEAIEELERKAIPHMVCTVYPENVDFEAVFASESYRPNDFQLASLQLTERVLARRIVPMKILSLRHWHSFAVAKCLLHESRRKSFAVTKELMQTQIKIGTLIASRKAWRRLTGRP